MANRTLHYVDILPACCTSTTPHITAPSAWPLTWWTGPMWSVSGIACTRHCCDDIQGGWFPVEAILVTCQCGNTRQHLIKWASYPDSFPWKVTWSASAPILSCPSSRGVVGGRVGAPCLHRTLRWQLQHVLWTAPWSSCCPAMPARCCTPKITITDFRVELPKRVLLHGNDYDVTLASFTYPRTWYNVPDLSGQMHMATFTFWQGHVHRDDGAIGNATAIGTEVIPSGEADDEAPADQHSCQDTMFIRSQWTLSPGYYECIRQILHDLNGQGRGSQIAFQFCCHAARNCIMVTFRPGLKACMGRVIMMRALSLLLGWPDWETLLLG